MLEKTTELWKLFVLTRPESRLKSCQALQPSPPPPVATSLVFGALRLTPGSVSAQLWQPLLCHMEAQTVVPLLLSP